MEYDKKIKAFTIIEMIIVIIISTIVAGLAFSVLSVVQKNMRSIEANYTEKTTLQQLEQSLVVAFNTYTEVYWDEQEMQLLLKSPIAETMYQFYTDSIVTDRGVFKLKVHEKLLYHKGEIIDSGRIDAIKLNFSEKNDFQRIFVFQQKDVAYNEK